MPACAAAQRLSEGAAGRCPIGGGRPWPTGAFFKGACTRGIYDNMKTAVDAVFARGHGGKERTYNRRASLGDQDRMGTPSIAQMGAHHLVEPVACTPAAGPQGLPGKVFLTLPFGDG